MTFKTIQYRAHNGYDTEQASDESTIKDFGPSLTVQSMAEDCDLNVIMERFGMTGKFPENPRIPQYIDMGDEMLDYRTALETVNTAKAMFMEYPAQLRARFMNDPQVFMEYCHNPENADEMRKLGLMKPKPPETTDVNNPNPGTNQPPRGNPTPPAGSSGTNLPAAGGSSSTAQS